MKWNQQVKKYGICIVPMIFISASPLLAIRFQDLGTLLAGLLCAIPAITYIKDYKHYILNVAISNLILNVIIAYSPYDWSVHIFVSLIYSFLIVKVAVIGYAGVFGISKLIEKY